MYKSESWVNAVIVRSLCRVTRFQPSEAQLDVLNFLNCKYTKAPKAQPESGTQYSEWWKFRNTLCSVIPIGYL